MTAGRLIKPFAPLAMLLLVSSCTVSCKAKEGGAKEMAENLKTHLEMNLVEGITRVTCPPGAKQKKGKKYDCTVYLKTGKTTTVMMEWVDHSLFKAFRLIPQKEAEKNITDWVTKQRGKVKSITCPKRMVLKPKKEYKCVAVDGAGAKRDIRLWVTDKGQYRWEVVKKKGAASAPPKGTTTKTPPPKGTTTKAPPAK